jgi:hypothetical protein
MKRIKGNLATIQWRELGREHGLPLFLFGLLAVAMTWPTILNFTTRIVSDGGDARNNLWMLWHVREAIMGDQPWFELDLLYYPVGVNLLTRGLGPLVGIFALPFWLLGPQAAYNGTMIITVWLTGYGMYLFARGLNFDRKIAFFASLFLMSAPILLAGVTGHLTKSFLALLPLVLLAFYRLLDLKRSRWWAVVTAVLLLLTLLHNGYQFIFAGLAIVFFGVAAFIRAERMETRPLFLRGLMLAGATAILVGPLLIAILNASADPFVRVNANIESINFQPDVSEFFLPPAHSLVFGQGVESFLLEQDHKPGIETAVSLSWTGIFLCIVAVLRARKISFKWGVFTLLCAILAVGPSIKFLGERIFTEYEFPIIMPYAFLTALPGFDFMRAPGRFMMIGYVTMAITAAYGLAWLAGRFPKFNKLFVVAATAFLMLEWWPGPWNQQPLRDVSDFYMEIADDPELYGVFDLPVRPAEENSHVIYAATYQMDQMVHQKGIASGYLARTYRVHPMFPCIIPDTKAPEPDVMVNGQPADCTGNFLFDLANFNYRYVVLHKPAPDDWYDTPDSWGQREAAVVIERFFGQQTPLVDDNLVTVYEVPPLDQIDGLGPTIGLSGGWYGAEDEWRWARSPAVMFLSIPQLQNVTLEMLPALIYDPGSETGIGQMGQLKITISNGYSTTVQIQSGEPTTIPLNLEAGVYSVTLELETGEFRPTDYGYQDERPISFAVHWINLSTE